MSFKTLLLRNSFFRLAILFAILTLGIFVRMYAIDNPLADWHSFRQADTVSVARLYSLQGVDLLNPKYHDISTIQSGLFNPEGYRFVEFPIYNALIVGFSNKIKLISLEVWGRMLSIAFATISGILIYILGKRYINVWGGVLAAFFFMFIPFNIYFTRVILPEPLATMLAMLGLVLFVCSEDNRGNFLLTITAFVFSLAILVKPFTVFYLIPLLPLVLYKYKPTTIYGFWVVAKKHFLFLVIVILPFLLWRQWESRHPEGIPFYDWIFNGDGIRFKPSFWRWIFGERLGYLILGTWGLVPFVYGLIKKNGNYFIHHFLVGMILYLSVVATANVRHDYYQTLIIPAIALALSSGSIGLIKQSISARIILVFSIFIMIMVGLTKVREFYKIDHPEIIDTGVVVDNLIPKSALIIAPYNGDTAFLYQTKRTGWPYVDRPIDEMIDSGAEYYVSVNFDVQTNEFISKFPIVRKTEKYVILDLKSKL